METSVFVAVLLQQLLLYRGCEKCPKRGRFKRKMEAIEEIERLSAPSKRAYLAWCRRTADIPDQTNWGRKNFLNSRRPLEENRGDLGRVLLSSSIGKER
jgi:hypothetical protein